MVTYVPMLLPSARAACGVLTVALVMEPHSVSATSDTTLG